ncbi:hypothetical protein EUTSA_v10002929mg [Eutrema salsugineum]|uniref:Uncharacterized protein n=1 Tax=Eutrema salsugineum TaxID=72664 RepID=V4L3P3_EUTSA|nr:hypothetical protein EUTSA_v10002929mg [Eutrema salsugineum]
MYANNGSGIILAEKGQFDIAKDLFTQIQEAGSGSVFLQMPDVWVNMAHYQNCLRKFFYNTDSQILFYLARTHYEAEHWIMSLLLQLVTCVRQTVTEAENVVRVFSQLSTALDLHVHGFDGKKIQTHVQYCTHLLEGANVHREARLEVARQAALAEAARRKAEEHRKYLVLASVARRRRALSSSDEEGELMESQPNSTPQEENSPGRQEENNVEEEEEEQDANLDDEDEESECEDKLQS